jgi:hypothetical protein
MAIARFVRVLVLLSIFGLAGPLVGCGAGGQQGPGAEDREAGRAKASAVRKSHRELKASIKSAGGGTDQRGASLRAKRGP